MAVGATSLSLAPGSRLEGIHQAVTTVTNLAGRTLPVSVSMEGIAGLSGSVEPGILAPGESATIRLDGPVPDGSGTVTGLLHLYGFNQYVEIPIAVSVTLPSCGGSTTPMAEGEASQPTGASGQPAVVDGCGGLSPETISGGCGGSATSPGAVEATSDSAIDEASAPGESVMEEIDAAEVAACGVAAPAESAISEDDGAALTESAVSEDDGAVPTESVISEDGGAVPTESVTSKGDGAAPVDSAISNDDRATPAEPAIDEATPPAEAAVDAAAPVTDLGAPPAGLPPTAGAPTLPDTAPVTAPTSTT